MKPLPQQSQTGWTGQLPVWLCVNVKQEILRSDCSISQVQTVTNDWSSFQLQRWMGTLVLSVQTLKEEKSHLDAVILSMERWSSSVRTNVKKRKTFSLKQMETELRVADTASNIKKDLRLDCLWPSHRWPNRTPDITGVVTAEPCLLIHTLDFRSLL